MKEIIAQLIEHVFGNDKVLIIFAIAFLGGYCAYMFGIQAKDIVGNCVSGLLGMAIGQKMNIEAPK